MQSMVFWLGLCPKPRREEDLQTPICPISEVLLSQGWCLTHFIGDGLFPQDWLSVLVFALFLHSRLGIKLTYFIGDALFRLCPHQG